MAIHARGHGTLQIDWKTKVAGVTVSTRGLDPGTFQINR